MRPCWHPAAPNPARTQVCVRSLRTTRTSPVCVQRAGKVRDNICHSSAFIYTYENRQNINNNKKWANDLSDVCVVSLAPPSSPLPSIGQTCEVDINECVKNPCLNGATCENTKGNYRCGCKAGYAGRNCETNIDDCKPSKSPFLSSS